MICASISKRRTRARKKSSSTPSGVMLPFALTLVSGEHRVVIQGNVMGQIEVDKGTS